MKRKPIAMEPVKRTYPRKPVSEFVETLDSHCIYDSNELAIAFKRECGFDATWPTETIAETRKTIRKRGLGGSVKVGIPKQTLSVSGVVVAEWAARTFAIMSDVSILGRLHGLGSRYNAAFGILKTARL